MIRRRLTPIFALVFAMSAGLCPAQDKTAKPAKHGREQRAPKLREIGIRDPEGFVTQMDEELKLTDSQKSQIKRYVDEFQHESDDLKNTIPRSPDSGKAFSDLREQMEQARQSGDKARQQQVMEQLKAKQQEREAAEAPLRAKLEASQKTLHDRIASTIGEKQRTDFELIWEDATAGRRRPGGDVNPRALHAAVMRLPDLTGDQKKKLDDLFKANEKAAQDAKSAGQRRRVNQTLQSDVMNVLTKEQKEKVAQQMERRAARPRNAPKKAEPPKGG